MSKEARMDQEEINKRLALAKGEAAVKLSGGAYSADDSDTFSIWKDRKCTERATGVKFAPAKEKPTYEMTSVEVLDTWYIRNDTEYNYWDFGMTIQGVQLEGFKEKMSPGEVIKVKLSGQLQLGRTDAVAEGALEMDEAKFAWI